MSLRRWVAMAALAVPMVSAVAMTRASISVGQPASTLASADNAAGTWLEVDLSERRLRVMSDKEVLKSYPVAIGKSEHPTPRGSFAIRRVVWNPRWVPPKEEWAKDKTVKEPGDPDNPMGKVKLFFKDPDYYIHGTNAEESLGLAASHGCLRMANSDVIELAKIVMENSGETRPPSWYRRVLNFVTSTHEVRLSNPIPVRIVGPS